MDNLKDWPIHSLLMMFETRIRQEELKRFLGDDITLVRREAEKCKAEILRRFPCVNNDSKS